MNTSDVNNTNLANVNNEDTLGNDLSDVFKVIWMIGMSLSAVALILQMLLFIILPNTRKVKLMILTHLTLARLIHVTLEYVINTTYAMHPILLEIVFSVYFQADAVLICWMTVFTCNLFYKVIIVFPPRKFYFTIASLLIWIVTIPLGVMNNRDLSNGTLYNVCAIIKFVVLTVNAGLIVWIYIEAVMYRRKNKTNKSKDIVKTCVVAFVVVSVTSVQVLLTDLQSFFDVKGERAMYTFSVINSFQALVITLLFFILANSACENKLMQKISTKLKRIFGINPELSIAQSKKTGV